MLGYLYPIRVHLPHLLVEWPLRRVRLRHNTHQQVIIRSNYVVKKCCHFHIYWYKFFLFLWDTDVSMFDDTHSQLECSSNQSDRFFPIWAISNNYIVFFKFELTTYVCNVFHIQTYLQILKNADERPKWVSYIRYHSPQVFHLFRLNFSFNTE